MMKLFVTLLLFGFSASLSGQDSIAARKKHYEEAYREIVEMLDGKRPYSFKRAVFATENCFLNNTLDYEKFNHKIASLAQTCSDYARANSANFLYDYDDKETIIKHAALFRLMTDSIPLVQLGGHIVHTIPYTYDFDDFRGRKDWSKMFVSKLLVTHKGNCHSLPYLYKIIAEEMGLAAHLALAPDHMYIKLYSRKTGMYNTELTNAAFPVDAWLMASGYIHMNAVRGGIYMDTLSKKQSLSLCLLDLAKGYERTFGTDDSEFPERSAATALKHYPNYVNALLLQSEIMKRKLDHLMIRYHLSAPQDIPPIQEGADLFNNYEKIIQRIYTLGYRKMPEKMYLNWLLDLKESKEKYTDKKVITNFNALQTN